MEKGNTNHPPVDLTKIFKTLWASRKLYFIVMPIALIVTYLLTLLVPRYYNCAMELAPETNGNSTSGSLSSLASSFGISGLSKLGGQDAISPLLYPDLLGSPDFIVTLLPIMVTTKDGATYTYYEYIDKHQKSAFWDEYIIDPIKGLMDPTQPSPAYKPTDKIDLHHLTKKQDDVIKCIAGKIKCNVDKKTDAINIIVEDQDPQICTTIGDSVLNRMQKFIIAYRTKKARNDYEYYDKIVKEAEKKYNINKAKYAAYADTHQDAVLESVNAEEESMRDNMSSAYDVYAGMSKMRDQAKAKIQENTPAFTVIKSASLPQKPAGPKRMFLSIGMMMLAAVIVSFKVLYKLKED